MTIYMAHSTDMDATLRLKPMVTDRGRPERFREWVEESIPLLRARLDLLARGVDVAEYDRFNSLTPRTTILHGDLSRYPVLGQADPSREDARFCIDFVVDSALALRENRVRARQVPKDQVFVRVTHRCDVVANPNGREREVVRVAKPGEELPVASQWRAFRHAGYLAVVDDDGDVGYVRQHCVTEAAAT